MVECNTCEYAFVPILNQSRQSVAFLSKTFDTVNQKHVIPQSKEAEAALEVESISRQKTFHIDSRPKRSFTWLDSFQSGKIKIKKYQIWQIKLGNFDYATRHRPRKLNFAKVRFHVFAGIYDYVI